MSERPSTEVAEELAFERALLASARADELPAEATRDAWSRFAAASGALALGSAASQVAGARFWSKATWTRGWRWLAGGALAGSAVTLAVVGWRSAGVAEVAVVEARKTAVVTVPSVSASGAEAALSAERGAASAQPREWSRGPAVSSAGAGRGAARNARGSGTVPGERSTASTLAAEIAALDGVRRAMADGAFERAVQAADAYAREFPHGQLSADADALAAQALSAQGEHRAAKERAARFLAAHPDDPHAARMRRLLDQ